jgi:hypothetical protein
VTAAPPRAPQSAGVGFSCFNYGQIGHFSRECPHPRQGFIPRPPPPPISQPKVAVRPSPSKVGRANFTTLEEVPLREEVLTGTFFLFEHPIIILFDSRASHDFLSLVCAQKVGITLCATQVPYSISTPGGRVVANQMAQKILALSQATRCVARPSASALWLSRSRPSARCVCRPSSVLAQNPF